MSYTREQLCGIAYPLAECYGKPHYMAHYLGKNPTLASVDKYELDDDAVCICCGARATNSHHSPPKGIRRVFNLRTDRGSFLLRPSLLAVCGSGTTGCHGKFHSGLLKVQWIWDEEGFLNGWWSGSIPESYEIHSSDLYTCGFWRITDSAGDVVREVRV